MPNKISLLPLLCLLSSVIFSQGVETRSASVHAVKLFRKGDQNSMAVAKLGEIESLELHFDDFQSSSRSYYYTYQLCDADWQPANLSQMDYIRGFSQNRIMQYRYSSIAFTRYVHYQVNLPQGDCMPSRSGNYILKVFENGDTSRLLFSRRMIVLDDKLAVAAQVAQPFSQMYYNSYQKVITRLNIGSLDVYNPAQQLKVVVMQNYRWDNARTASAPTFIRGQEYEYSNEDNFVFEGGKEFRWLDLRSYRLQSDRVRKIDYLAKSYEVYPVPDSVRNLRYLYYNDLNGTYTVQTLEDINPWWQGDYATVHFTFVPDRREDFARRQLFLIGEMTNWDSSPQAAMKWNEDKQAYEKDILLKNGYYSYAYATREGNGPLTFQFTEGNFWDAENQYTVLVYYRPFGGRSDELIGYTEINSRAFLNTPQ